MHQRLANLSNRIAAEDQEKIISSVHARIPMFTIGELRAVQRESAEADEKFWSGLQDMNADLATGQREAAKIASRKADDAEAPSKRRGG